MYKRAEILEYLIVLNILNYDEVLENILAVSRMGIEKAYVFYQKKAVEKAGSKIVEEVRKKVRDN
jgi:hypothetical protein